MERCRSPLNPDCGNWDIALYIFFEGKRLPVCRKCWRQMAETDLEWGESIPRARVRRLVEEAKRAILEKARGEALKEVAERLERGLGHQRG